MFTFLSLDLNPYSVIELCAFLISAISVVVMQIGTKKSGSKDYIIELEHRTKYAEEKLEICEENCKELRDQNLTLLIRLARIEHNDRK
jgi:hypothetical protein